MLLVNTALFLSFTVLIAGIYSVESVGAAETYKIWVLAYNVKPEAGFVSACAFGPSVDTPNCAYFDLSKVFIEKGGKKDFIAGFVSIVSNMPPPADMQVCLEAQLLNGTNASPGDWSQCGPVTKDNKGFYVSKTDFSGLDHSKLGPYHANMNTNTSTSKSSSNTDETFDNQQANSDTSPGSEIATKVANHAQSHVSISPSCGPAKGFKIIVKADGFKPDNTVLWDLGNSQSQIPMIPVITGLGHY